MYVNESQEYIMEALRRGPCTIRLLEIYTGYSVRTIRKALIALQKAGAVSAAESGGYVERWSLTLKGRSEQTERRHRGGRALMATDSDVVRAVRDAGSINGATAHLEYVDRDWVRRRLRRMGLPGGKPGRPYGDLLQA